MVNDGVTHVGVATDHVIESFRNGLWRGYKTSAGVPRDLLSQFPILEDALTAMGVVVWPMVEFEADDALAAAAAALDEDARVDRVIICTPDKDLAQSVRGTRVVQLNRRTREIRDEAGVIARFGVPPSSIPDYLALVGDASDGYPGLRGWGAKSAAAVLARFGHLEAIPDDWHDWHANVTNPAALAQTLVARTRPRHAVSTTRDAAHRSRALRQRGSAEVAGTDDGIREAGDGSWRGRVSFPQIRGVEGQRKRGQPCRFVAVTLPPSSRTPGKTRPRPIIADSVEN